MSIQDIISDDEIIRVHANANFGDYEPRYIVNYGLLKCASGYYQGSTSRAILTDHNLIDKHYKLTAKGRMYLWEAFRGGSTL